jgi:hypothetical protein
MRRQIELHIAGPRVSKLLGDADHVAAGLHSRHHLRLDLVQVGLRVDAHDVGLLGEYLLEVRGHHHVAWLAKQLADRLPVLGRIGDHTTDELDVLGTVEHEPE